VNPVVASCAFILGLDAVGALVARVWGPQYGFSWGLQIIAYFSIGFVVRTLGSAVQAAFAVVIVAGIAEATIGSWLAARIGPAAVGSASPGDVVNFALNRAIFATVVGGFGVVAGSINRRGRSS
jgi:hypothetical protein